LFCRLIISLNQSGSGFGILYQFRSAHGPRYKYFKNEGDGVSGQIFLLISNFSSKFSFAFVEMSPGLVHSNKQKQFAGNILIILWD